VDDGGTGGWGMGAFSPDAMTVLGDCLMPSTECRPGQSDLHTFGRLGNGKE